MKIGFFVLFLLFLYVIIDLVKFLVRGDSVGNGYVNVKLFLAAYIDLVGKLRAVVLELIKGVVLRLLINVKCLGIFLVIFMRFSTYSRLLGLE